MLLGRAKRIVFVFGNRLEESDSIAPMVADRLRGKFSGIEFREADEPADLPAAKSRETWILDAAEGIRKVTLIEGTESLLAAGAPVSLHDFDLQFELRLLGKIGRLGRLKIIAIPRGYNIQKAAAEAGAILAKAAAL
jgi:hypothetical protein